MRIVAGELRGRTLVAPKGQSTRPTADRVRQALFDVLEHAPWSEALAGRRVLDLFAGSGALGLEALSRGAAFCLFVDNALAATEAIETNLRSLGLGDRAGVRRLDASRMGTAKETFDLVFLDPPYGEGLVEPALEGSASGGWLAASAMVVVERGAGEGAPISAGYQILDARAWGAARVDFLRVGQ